MFSSSLCPLSCALYQGQHAWKLDFNCLDVDDYCSSHSECCHKRCAGLDAVEKKQGQCKGCKAVGQECEDSFDCCNLRCAEADADALLEVLPVLGLPFQLPKLVGHKKKTFKPKICQDWYWDANWWARIKNRMKK